MQKIMKRLFIMVMAAMLFLLPAAAQAASSGTCGASLNWTLNDAGTLTISGKGKMTDYEAGGAPWGTGVTKLIVEPGVTSIGNYAFYNCTKLTTAEVANHVTTVGDASFKGCTALKTMKLLTATEEQSTGDANEDGAVDVLDALMVLKHNAGWNVLINDSSADVNGDGTLDTLDVLSILQHYAGWDVEGLPTNLSALIRLLMSYINPCTHTGRTELVGAVEATLEKEGYTGDLHCLECGEVIEPGTVLPKLMELPVTGDASNPALWLMMLLLSGGALLLLRRSKALVQH